MATAQSKAHVDWSGDLMQGNGQVSVGSGSFGPLPISWRTRTERAGGGTSPEELIAAAHAGCYAMALSNTLARHGSPPENLSVDATCNFEFGEGGARITSIELSVTGRVPSLSQEEFKSIAEEAEKDCPVSNALRNNVEIRLNAQLA